MKSQKVIALLLSTVLSISACMPLANMTVFGAEADASVQATAEQAESADTAAEETEASEEPAKEQEVPQADTVDETSDTAELQETEIQETEAEMPLDSETASDAEAVEEAAAIEEDTEESDSQEGESPEIEEATESVTADDTANIGSSVDNQEEAETAEDSPVITAPADTEVVNEEAQNYLVDELYPSDFNNALGIKAGDVKKVNITERDGYVLYRFVPEKTATYLFYSSNEDGDPMARLMDSSHSQIDFSNDANGNNFEIKQILLQGETYFYQCALSSDDSTGSYSVHLEEKDGFYCESVGPEYRVVPLHTELTLSVNAVSSSPLTYQWYVNSGDGRIEGATSPTFSYTPTESGTCYCIIDNGDHYQSQTVTYIIQIDNALTASIKNTDYSIYVAPGASVKLEASVSATDMSSLTYKWYDGYPLDTPIEGANGLTYTTEPIVDAHQYVFEVSDQYGNSASSSVFVYAENKLKVESVKDYLFSLKDGYTVIVKPGQTEEVKVLVTGSDTSRLTYSWYGPNGLVEGNNTDSISVGPITKETYYSVTVEDQYGNTAFAGFTFKIDNNLRVTPADQFENISPVKVYAPLNSTKELGVNVSANDTSQLTYTWKNGEAEYIGSNTPSITTPPITKEQFYNCTVEDQYGNTGFVIFRVYPDNLTVYPEGEDVSSTSKRINAAPGKPLKLNVILSTKYSDDYTCDWSDRSGTIEGANSISYVIDSVTKNDLYTFHVKDRYGDERLIYFYVYADNNLVAHPDGADNTNSVNVYVEPGESATLKANVSASDTSSLTHEWSENYQVIAGASQNTYVTGPVTEEKRYQYTVSDQYGNKETLYFYVYPRVNVTLYPEGETDPIKIIYVSSGQSATLTVSLSSKNTSLLTYQWYKNNSPIPGANALSYKTEPFTGSVEDYTFKVTDPYGNSNYVYFYVDGKATLTGENVTVSASGLVYDGRAKKPAVKVTYKGNTLKEGTNYTVSYSNNTSAGTATVTIKGKDYYDGTVKKTFTIAKAAQPFSASASAGSVSVSKTAAVKASNIKERAGITYTSSNNAVATVSSTGLVKGVKVGTVTITAKAAATANYKAASKSVTIKIVPAATTSLTAANQTRGFKLTWRKVAGANGYIIYRNGTKIKTINNGNTVTCTDTGSNTNGTKYVFKIVAKASTGNSTLSKSVTAYRVAQPVVKTLTNSSSKKMTVKWNKNAKANGYQIQYSTSRNFASGNKTVNITRAATISKVIGSLVKGKTYYVRIRTYKTVSGSKYWSAWSTAKKVKISK